MCVKIIIAGFRNTGIYPYNPLAIPPCHWPQVKSLTMVRHFGVSVGVGFLISSSRSMGVLYWIILTGTACLHFCKEKKHIGFKKLFRLITRNISPLWEGRTVGFHLQGLAFTKSCHLNFSSSGSSCSGSTSNRRTDTCNTGYNDYWDQTWKYQ